MAHEKTHQGVCCKFDVHVDFKKNRVFNVTKWCKICVIRKNVVKMLSIGTN